MSIEIDAKRRLETGSSKSRKIRRLGLVPGIIYGGNLASLPISFEHNKIFYALKKQEFHSSISTINIDGQKEMVLLRNVEMHIFKPQVMHIDFERVHEDKEVDIEIPVHFLNESVSVAVKAQGAQIVRVANKILIRAMVKYIPKYIEIDLINMRAGETIHLSNLSLPHGVRLVNLLRGEDSALAISEGIADDNAQENK